MNTRGFTLIELLVVVLIIGILAAVAVPQYQKAVCKVHRAKLISIMSVLRKSVEIAVLSTTTGPLSMSDYLDQLGVDLPCHKKEGYIPCYDEEGVGYMGYGEAAGSNSVYVYPSPKHKDACGDYYLFAYRYPSGSWELRCSTNAPMEGYEKMCKDLCTGTYTADGWCKNGKFVF